MGGRDGLVGLGVRLEPLLLPLLLLALLLVLLLVLLVCLHYARSVCFMID